MLEQSYKVSAMLFSQGMVFIPQQYSAILVFSDGAQLQEQNYTQQLHAGEIAILSLLSYPRIYFTEDTVVLCVRFDHSLISSNVGEFLNSFVLNDDKKEIFYRFRTVMVHMLEIKSKENLIEQNTLLMSMTYELMTCMNVYGLNPSYGLSEQEFSDQRLQKLSQYIRANFKEQISMKDAADFLHLTPQYFSRFFRMETGMTFTAWLINIRLDEAKRLLLTTDFSVNRIAFESGFSNITSLQHAFQKYCGQTPKEFRKNTLENERYNFPSELDFQSVLPMILQYSKQDWKDTCCKSLNLSVDASSHSALKPIWCDCINIENAAQCIEAEFQEELRDVQMSLKFQYARLRNVMSHELTPYVAKEQRHRYGKFHNAVSFLLSIGLKPMINLVRYPMIVGNLLLDDGPPFGFSDNDFTQDCIDLLNASIERWGKNEVSNWRFELWLPQCIYDMDDVTEYVNNFKRIYHIFKKILPTIQIGGSAYIFHGQDTTPFFSAFEKLKFGNVIPDFVTIALYGNFKIEKGEPNSTHMLNSPTIYKLDDLSFNAESGYLQQLNDINFRLHEIFHTDLPVIVAEFGLTPTSIPIIADTAARSAHIIKTVIQLIDQVDGLGYWKFMNDESEYTTEKDLLCGGCGLVGRYHLYTPAWYAYYLLHQLGRYLIFKNEVCLLTTNGLYQYQLLIHNCKGLNQKFFEHMKDGITLTSLSTFYEDTGQLCFNMELHDIPNGEYQIQYNFLDDEHGTVLQKIESLGKNIEKLNDYDLQWLRANSGLGLHYQTVLVEQTLNITVTLEANGVCLIVLDKQ